VEPQALALCYEEMGPKTQEKHEMTLIYQMKMDEAALEKLKQAGNDLLHSLLYETQYEEMELFLVLKNEMMEISSRWMAEIALVKLKKSITAKALHQSERRRNMKNIFTTFTSKRYS